MSSEATKKPPQTILSTFLHYMILLPTFNSIIRISHSSLINHTGTRMKTYHLHQLLLSCLSLLYSISQASSNFSSAQRCINEERSALLHLKEGFSIEPELFSFPLPPPTFSLLPSWETGTDCCSWERITCNKKTGHVISLDLSSSWLSGNISSISLCKLGYLRVLNLADNYFVSSLIPSGLDHLSRLTHLNLSYSGFSGQIPMDISNLTNLVSFDLSAYGSRMKLERPNLRMLVQNLTSLRELVLDGVNISSQGNEWCKVLSAAVPNLRVLSLSSCGLLGPISTSISHLHFLSQLNLNRNNLSSVLPESFVNFSSLTSLQLHSCELYGEFPKQIFQLPFLEVLQLAGNTLLIGSLPAFPRESGIRVLSLTSTSFFGEIPDSIAIISR
ncbi:hypothetical protein GIB67_001782 [Kingdonia uniflora]|uniref:Leucine-rich repeat-containing N-terminal plant-type domain-containing protein n=1 Tax=Kingdonia uniflora TaxID=39325 RepID=A0A7J7LBJ3_9MAGN|nr:hypothetical protein GIB67_001782 [Kingdonia uniflora]